MEHMLNRHQLHLFLWVSKQWGKTISGNNVKTKFPIAFTAFCMLSVSVNSSNGNAAESVFRNGFGYTNKTLSDWILRGPTSDATYFADYIAIGCQPQWGFTNNTGRPYITFPFKFSNVFTAISCICHNGSPSEANTVYNVSISGMNIGASGGGSGKYWCAFGVAQQQWGYSTGGSGAWALKFNGVYTAVVVGAPGFPAREFCGFTFDYTLTGWSFTAGYNSPISYIRPTTTAISLGY